MKDLRPFIQAYIENWVYINNREEYKWEAIKHFQDNFNIDSSSTSLRTINALAKHGNLLDSHTYFPLAMLNDVAKEKQDVTDKLLTLLFDENQLLKDRVKKYMSEFDETVKKMANEGHSDWKGRDNLQSFQDPHAISVYLALRYPSKYYIYKYSIFVAFSNIVEFERHKTDKIDRLLEFYDLCSDVKKEILKEEEFITMYKDWMRTKDYTDPELNLLTQDFIYAVARYLNGDVYVKAEKKKPISNIYHEIEASQFPIIENIISEKKFKGIKGVDYAKKDNLYRGLGLLGEEWVLTYEKERLNKLGISHKVIHTSVEEGDGKGYDIESVEDDGETPRYIEVKTTTGNVSQPFYYSENELVFSEKNSEHYYIYRVYNFKDATKQADLLIIHGSMEDLKGKPVTYKATAKIIK